MTVKELIETMVEFPDRVLIIDEHLDYHTHNMHNPIANRDLKQRYYRRNVKRWVFEHNLRKVGEPDPYTGETKGYIDSIYIELKGDTKK